MSFKSRTATSRTLRLPLAAAAAALLAGSVVALAPQSVGAGGPSTSCSAGYYCLSQFAFTTGSTATTMSYGWRQYAPLTNDASNRDSFDGAYNYLGCPSPGGSNDTFSTSGGCVGGNVESIRNRDTINGKTLNFVNFQSEFPSGYWYAVTSVSYAFTGWKQTTAVEGQMWALYRSS